VVCQLTRHASQVKGVYHVQPVLVFVGGVQILLLGPNVSVVTE